MANSIIAVEGQFATSIVNALGRWREVGLLEPYILLDESGEVSPNSPITGSGSNVEGLLAELGMHNVHLFVVRPSWSEPGLLDQLAIRLRQASADPTQRDALGLVATNLLCAPRHTPDSYIEWNSVAGLWNHHLIVAPEDRVDERAFTAVDDSDDALAARAAFSVGVLSGLLRGIEVPHIESIVSSDNSIRAIRCFGRVVAAPPNLVANLRSALEQTRVDESRMKDCVGGLAAKDPVHHVAVVARAFSAGAADGVLMHHSYVRNPAPVAIKITWRRALQMLKEYVAGLIRGRIHDLTFGAIDRAAAAAVKRANDLLFGANSAYELAIDPGRDKVEVQLAEKILQNDSDGPINIPAQPQLWRDLRLCMFSLVDGTAPLSFIPESSFNGQPYLVTNPALLAPDPRSSVGLPAATVEDTALPAIDRACDVAAAVKRRMLVGAERDKTKVDNPSDTTGPVIGQAILQELDAWEDPRKDSLTYGIAKSLAGQVTTAEESLQINLSKLEAMAGKEKPQPSETIKPKRRRRRRRLFVALEVVVIILVIAAPAVALAFGVIAVVAWIVLQIVTVVVATVRLFMRWMRWLRTKFQEANRLNLEGYEAHELVEATLHGTREILRLSALYDELVEWSAAEEIVVSGPLSLSIADAVISPPRLERLSARLAARLFERGWLTRLFTSTSREANEKLRYRRGEESKRQGLDADYDVAAQRGDVDRLNTELSAQERGQTLDKTVTQFISSSSLQDLFEADVTTRRLARATPIVDFLAGIRPDGPPTSFDSSLSLNPNQEELRKVIDPPWTCGLGDPPGINIVDPEANQMFSVAWRLDISEAGSKSQLRRKIAETPSERTPNVRPTV
jgi:hypothetical protein